MVRLWSSVSIRQFVSLAQHVLLLYFTSIGFDKNYDESIYIQNASIKADLYTTSLVHFSPFQSSDNCSIEPADKNKDINKKNSAIILATIRT